MFENVVWGIVKYYAHKYVKGIKPEELRISLWQGHATMHNVELNTDELESLNLPLHVKRGFIRELCIRIPWTAILSDSVQVDVTGLVLEMIPNHQYTPSSKPPKEAGKVAGARQAEPPKPSPYVSQLADRILENIKVNVKQLRMSFSDTEGSFPSVVHVSIQQLKFFPSNASAVPKAKQAGGTCEGCAAVNVDASWPQAPLPDVQGRPDRVKEVIVERLCVYVQEVPTQRGKEKKGGGKGCTEDPAATPKSAAEGEPKEGESAEDWLLRDTANLHAVVKDVNLQATVVIRDVPYTHLHFCKVFTADPIDFHLRDIDLQAFCLMMNELKAIFMKRPPRAARPSPTDPPAAPEEEGGVVSWFGSAVDLYSSWLKGSQAEPKSRLSVSTPRQETADSGLEQFEPKELQLLLESKEKQLKAGVEAKGAVATTRLLFSFPSISCTLTQHVEFPVLSTGTFCVIPRPIVSLTLKNFVMAREEMGKKVRMHVFSESLSVRDLWTSNTLFPEIVGARAEMWDDSRPSRFKAPPQFHLVYHHNLSEGELPSLDIGFEPLQVACPPLLVKRLAVFFDTALPKQHALFKRHPHLRKFHDDQAAAAAEKSARGKLATVAKNKVHLRVNVALSALRMIVCNRSDDRNSDCVVVEITQVILTKLPSDWQSKLDQPEEVFGSVPAGREVVRHVRITLRDLQVSTGTVSSVMGASNFVLVQPLTFEFLLTFSSSPDNGASSINAANAEEALDEDEQPAEHHAQYICVSCDVPRVNVSLARDKLANVARVIGDLADTFSSTGGGVSQPSGEHEGPSTPPPQPPVRSLWRPLYGSSAPEEGLVSKPTPPGSPARSTEPKLGRTFVLLAASCAEVSVLFVGTDETLLSEEEPYPVYTPLVELQVRKLGAELSVYLNATTEKQVVRFATSLQSVLLLDRMRPANSSVVIATVVPERSSPFFSNDAPTTPGFRTPATHTPRQPDFSSTPLRHRLSQSSSGTPTVSGSFPADYHFVSMTPSVVTLQRQLPDTPSAFRTPTQRQPSVDSVERSSLFPGFSGILSAEHLGASSRLSSAQDSAIRFRVVQLITPGVGTVPEVRARLSVSQLHGSFTGTLVHFVQEFTRERASEQGPKEPTVHQRLRKLTQSQLLWQFAYLKMLAVMKQRIRQEAAEEGVPCLRFKSWSDYEAYARLRPRQEHWLTFSTLSSYFQSVLSHLSITVNRAVFTLPGPSTVLSSTQLDVVVPKLVVHSAQQSGFSHGTLVLDMNVKQVHGYLSRFSNVQTSASLFDSSLDEAASEPLQTSQGSFSFGDFEDSDVVFSKQDASFLNSTSESADSSFLFDGGTPSGYRLDGSLLDMEDVHMSMLDDQVALSKRKVFNIEQMACRIVSRLNRQEQSSVLFAVDGFVDGIHVPLCTDLIADAADIGQYTKSVFEQAHLRHSTEAKHSAPPLIAAPVQNAPGGGAVTCYNLLVKSVVVLCLENEEEVVRLKVNDMELIYSTHRSQSVNINGAIGSLELLDVQNTCAPQIIATITERPLLSLHVSREAQPPATSVWNVSVTCTGYLVRYRAAFVDRVTALCRPPANDRSPSISEWPGELSPSAPSSDHNAKREGVDSLSTSESYLALTVPHSASSTSIFNLGLDVTNVKIVVVGPSPHVLDSEAELAGHFHFQRLRATYQNDDAKGFTSLDVHVEDGRYTAAVTDTVDFAFSNCALRLVDGQLSASRAHRESSSGLQAPFPLCWYTTVTFTEPTAVMTDETLRDLLLWLGTFSDPRAGPKRPETRSAKSPTEDHSSKQALTFSLRQPNITAVAGGEEIFRLGAKRFDIHISSGVPSRENGTTFTLYQVSGTAPASDGAPTREVLRLAHADPEEVGWAIQCELLRPRRTAVGGPSKSTIIQVGSVWLDVVPFAAAAARLHLLVARASPPTPQGKAPGVEDSDSSPHQGVRLEGTVASAKAVARLRPDEQELEMVALAVRAAMELQGNVLLGLDCSCERTYVAYNNPQAVIVQQMVLADMFGACCKLHQGGRGQAVLYTDVDLIKLRLPLVEVHAVSRLLASLSSELSAATGDVSVLPRSETLFTGEVCCAESALPKKNTLQSSSNVEVVFIDEEGGYRVTGAQTEADTSLTWTYAAPHRVTCISWKAAAAARATRPLFASLHFFNTETQQFEVAVSVLPANTLSQAVTARLPDVPSSCSWRLVLHPSDEELCENATEPFPVLKELRLLAVYTSAPILAEEAAVPRPLLTLKATLGSVEMATMTMHTTDSPLFVLQCDTSRLDVKLARTTNGVAATGKASLSATLVYQDFHTLRLEEVLCAQPQVSFSYTRHRPGSGIHDRLTVSCTQPDEAPQLTVRVTRPLVQLLRNATSFLQHHGQLQGTGSVGMFYHYRIHNCTNAELVLRDMACPYAADFVVAAGATRYFKWNLSPVPQQQRRIHLIWGTSWKSAELELTNAASTCWFPLSPMAESGSSKPTDAEQHMALVVTAPPVADDEEVHVSRVYDAFFCLSHKLVNVTDLPLRMRFSHPSRSETREQSLLPAPASKSTAFATLASDGQQRVSVGVGDGVSWSSAIRLRDSQFASLIRCYDAVSRTDRYLWLTVNRECMGSSTQRVEGPAAECLSFVVLTVSPVYQLANLSPLPMHWRLQHGSASLQCGTVAAQAEVAFYCSPRKVTELFVAAVLPSTAGLPQAQLATAEQLEWSGALAVEGVASREHHLSTGRGWVAPAAFVSHVHMYVRQKVAATVHNSRRLSLTPSQLLQNDTEEVLWVGQVSPSDKSRMLDCVRLEAGASCPYAFTFPNERPTSLAVFRSEPSGGAVAALTADAALAVGDVDTILGVENQRKSGTYLAGYASLQDGGAVVNHQYVAVASVAEGGQAQLRLLPPLILQNETAHRLALCLGGLDANAAANVSYAAPGETVHLHHWAAAEAQVHQLLRCVNLRLCGEGWSWRRVDLSESRREALLAEDPAAEAVTACAWRNDVSGETAAFLLLLLPQEKGCLRLCFVDAPPLPFRFVNAVPHRLHCRLTSATEGEEARVFSLHPGAALGIAAPAEGAALALRLDADHTWSGAVPLDRPRAAVLRLYGRGGCVAVEVALAFHGSDALVRFLHQPIAEAAAAAPPAAPSPPPFLAIPDARGTGVAGGGAAVAARGPGLAGREGLRSVLELELPALVLALAGEQEDGCSEVAQAVAAGLRLHVRPRGGGGALDVAAACAYLAVRDGSDAERVVVEWRGEGEGGQALEVDATLPLPSCQLLRRLAVRLGPLEVALDDRFVRRLLTAGRR